MDDLITTDGLIANDWFDRSLVQDLRELIIVSARQSRSLLDTQKAQTTWYLCTEFSLFFVKNFHHDDPSGKIKTTLLFSNESLEAQKEIQEYYLEVLLLTYL